VLHHVLPFGILAAWSAGYRAALPLCVIAVAHQARHLHLSSTVAEGRWLSTDWAWHVLVGVLAAEIVIDKCPGLAGMFHIVLTPVHAVSGAISLVAPAAPRDQTAHALLLVLGGALALCAHFVKVSGRQESLAADLSVNPLISILEELFLTSILLIALASPVAAIVVVAVFLCCGLCCAAASRDRREVYYMVSPYHRLVRIRIEGPRDVHAYRPYPAADGLRAPLVQQRPQPLVTAHAYPAAQQPPRAEPALAEPARAAQPQAASAPDPVRAQDQSVAGPSAPPLPPAAAALKEPAGGEAEAPPPYPQGSAAPPLKQESE